MPAVAPSVDFYFDVVCPYAYLAHTQIEGVCERAQVALTWKPVLLGGLFRVVGNGPDGNGPMPTMGPAKARLNLLDMRRWADLLEVPLVFPASHPNRSVLAMRTILASDDVARAAKALYRCYWCEGGNVADAAVVEAVLDNAGFDGAALVAKAGEQAIKDELRARVDEAAALGIFGVPAMHVHGGGAEDALYWGQDRLGFVADDLSQRGSAA